MSKRFDPFEVEPFVHNLGLREVVSYHHILDIDMIFGIGLSLYIGLVFDIGKVKS